MQLASFGVSFWALSGASSDASEEVSVFRSRRCQERRTRKDYEVIRMALRLRCLLSMAMFVALSLAIVVFCQGCIDQNDPPVSVTFRESMLKGAVLQLQNRSNVRMVCEVFVKNDSKNQSKRCSFGVPPNEMVEVGLLEMDWAFEPGEDGYVAVDGYRRKIYFEIKNGSYNTHIGF